MKTKSLGFIGGGRITRIFLQAFQNKNIRFRSIDVFDINSENTEKLAKKFSGINISELNKVASSDVVFVALHPPVIMETLEKISAFVSEKTVIISLAPKIKIAGILDKLKSVSRIVRLIPNATSVINEGYNPVCFSTDFSADEKQEILSLLNILGSTFEVSEDKLEAYAIISAMLPTYFWFQWKKLAELGVEFGLDANEARQTVYRSSVAALNTLYKSGLSMEEVFNLIPVKPIGENENEIMNIYDQKLQGLFSKLTS